MVKTCFDVVNYMKKGTLINVYNFKSPSLFYFGLSKLVTLNEIK